MPGQRVLRRVDDDERLGVNLYVTSPDHNGKVLMITDGKEIEFHTAY